MIINGFNGTSVIDFPGKITAIVYTSPCNFKCPYCHNKDLVDKNIKTLDTDYILSEIENRKNFIDAVTLTGGEPSLHKDIVDFALKIKKYGLLVKLDTNGHKPEVIEEMTEKKAVDYFAMDIKSSPEKYSMAAGAEVDLEKILRSITLIMNSGIHYEFRTTVVPGLVNEEDIEKICGIIKGAEKYILQQYSNENTYKKMMRAVEPYSYETIEAMAETAEKYIPEVKVYNAEKVG
ncbi:MAG: anaerobic ribonucleoside-triphosphate reductase activating protein [Candidatus Goldiibacteriota bacterium]